MDISFIIPCFNCKKTLPESLKSIIRLGLKSYEICTVDDASTDGTPEILNYFALKYPQIIKIGYNSKNKGGGYTRNKCVALSSYKNIFCLDSDNIIEINSFHRLLKSIVRDYDISAFGSIAFFYPLLGTIKLFYKKWDFKNKMLTFKDLLKSDVNPVSSGNYLYTKKLFNKIGGYEEDLGALDAYSFGYKALYYGYKLRIINDTTYYHCTPPNSYWRREEKKNTNLNNKIKLFLRYSNCFTKKQIQLLKETKTLTHFNDNKYNLISNFKEQNSIIYNLYKIIQQRF
jgi:glycosyltransferase involved in cell wall biosynthesis